MNKIFFFLLFLLAAASIHSKELFSIKNERLSALLQIDSITGLKKEVLINLPPTFVALTEMSDGKEKFYEFIPKGEDPFLWSEIITVMQTPTTNTIEQVLKNLETAFQAKKAKCHLSKATENDISVAFLIVDMEACCLSPDSKNGAIKLPDKRELLIMKLFQEKKGFSIIQFTTRYDSSVSLEAKEKMKKKMLEFLESCKIVS